MYRSASRLRVFALCAVAAASQAQAQNLSPSSPFLLAPPIVVTALRVPEAITSALIPVTVITRSEIERSQATSLPQLLAGRLGIQVASNGGFGKTSSLFLRGTNSNQVLVLVDGVRFGSVTTGDAPWSQIPLAQIQRIEITRGPQSSLYGSDAVGGVVQIFTRRPSQRRHVDATVGAGTYASRRASAFISGTAGDTGYSLTASHFRTSGYDVQQNNVPSGYGYNTPNQPDADGYRNNAISGWVTRDLHDGGQLSAHIFRAQGQTQYDGLPSNATDFINQVAGVSMKRPLARHWVTRLSLGESRNDNNNLNNGVHSSTFDSRIRTATWQNDFLIGISRRLTLGADWNRQQVSSDTAFNQTSRHNTGVFAVGRWAFGRNALQLSARRDQNSSYGAHGTGSVAWRYRFNDSLQLSASYGSAFDAPTFNELYYPGFGNPALGPEHSRSFDLGLAGKLGGGHWSIHTFRTIVRGLIVFVGPTFLPENAQRARIVGLETSYRLRQGPWRMHAALTALDATDQSTGLLLPRRSRVSGRLAIDREMGAIRLGAILHGRSASYDNTANTLRLGGYTLLDLRGSYRISRTLSVDASVDNLFDKQYQTAYTYIEPGRTLYVSLHYTGA